VRLVTLLEDGRRSCGLVAGDEVVDLADPTVGLPAGSVEVLALGDAARPALARAAGIRARRVPLAQARLGAPVHRPPAFLGIARNYEDHIAELGVERPALQTWFAKLSTCVVGPGDAVEVPSASVQVDYEGELGVVIGPRCRHVPVEVEVEGVGVLTNPVVDEPQAHADVPPGPCPGAAGAG